MNPSLIILDRDGVINFDSPHFIRKLEEWKPIPGSLEAIAALKKAGYQVAIATNQSGIGRGLYDLTILNAIHAEMQRRLAIMDAQIDVIAYCPHHPDEDCACRKPKSGMILDLFERLKKSPQETLIVGDSLRDLKAGWQAGCRAILVKTGNGARTLRELKVLKQDPQFSPLWWKSEAESCYGDLGKFVQAFLRQS